MDICSETGIRPDKLVVVGGSLPRAAACCYPSTLIVRRIHFTRFSTFVVLGIDGEVTRRVFAFKQPLKWPKSMAKSMKWSTGHWPYLRQICTPCHVYFCLSNTPIWFYGSSILFLCFFCFFSISMRSIGRKSVKGQAKQAIIFFFFFVGWFARACA